MSLTGCAVLELLVSHKVPSNVSIRMGRPLQVWHVDDAFSDRRISFTRYDQSREDPVREGSSVAVSTLAN